MLKPSGFFEMDWTTIPVRELYLARVGWQPAAIGKMNAVDFAGF